MANMKMELKKSVAVGLLVMMVAATMSLEGVRAATCFPLDCASYVLDGRAVPFKGCCIDVQDQFLLAEKTKKKGSGEDAGIREYCKAISQVQLFYGILDGAQLDLALGIPEKCGLNEYFPKGVHCAGKVIPGGVSKASGVE